eukprot:TRINITY_DN32089_c0_g1_i2.p1 TRINITY_DN32089_c0_g1~~TRINITY_DN32089_c0_g1_i2.p1  ORF type:complete len:364 (+),score=81.88 TRINITY_DN32089_c0_g1_i2:64-1155(+)
MSSSLSTKAEWEGKCKLCPDVVEWCPDEGCRNLLAWGTYEHQEATGDRKGALILAIAEEANAEDEENRGYCLKEFAEVECPGVYDIAWGPSTKGSGAMVAAAGADGSIRLFTGEGNQIGDDLVLREGIIVTHLNWGAGDEYGLAAVAQDGAAHLLKLREGGVLEMIARRQQHDIETWSVEVSPFDRNLVLTGADDAKLIAWDIREPPDARPAFVNTRAHEAGVTALAFDPLQPHRLATGSYDERVRLFDLRSMSGPATAESQRLDDGAYHLAWHPTWPDVIAVAAMRSGFPLLRVNGSHFEDVGSYASDAPEGKHGSLGYGISWQYPCDLPGRSDGRWFLASASFYDRSLHLWSVPTKIPSSD